jgi:hypothetical protein
MKGEGSMRNRIGVVVLTAVGILLLGVLHGFSGQAKKDNS